MTAESDEAQANRDKALRENDILRFFEYAHLPERLAAISKPFCEIAWHVALTTRGGAERSACLRKLLEAKDCAVRATL